MNYLDITVGKTITARYLYDHGKLQEGKAYKVLQVIPPHYAGNGFTFPAYVTVELPDGKPYTSHTHHYKP